MPFHKCKCGRIYCHQRSLSRHIKERHGAAEYWNCIKDDCSSKFIRRSYLSKHLMTKHAFSAIEARKLALSARRANEAHTSDNYFDDVSEDNSTFDILAELEELENIDLQDSAIDFDVDIFLDEQNVDDITLMEPEYEISIGDSDVIISNSENGYSGTDNSSGAKVSDDNSGNSNIENSVSQQRFVTVKSPDYSDISSESEYEYDLVANQNGVGTSVSSHSSACIVNDVSNNDSETSNETTMNKGEAANGTASMDDVIIISDDEDTDQIIPDDVATKRRVCYWTFTVRKTFTYNKDVIIHEEMDTSVDTWNYEI